MKKNVISIFLATFLMCKSFAAHTSNEKDKKQEQKAENSSQAEKLETQKERFPYSTVDKAIPVVEDIEKTLNSVTISFNPEAKSNLVEQAKSAIKEKFIDLKKLTEWGKRINKSDKQFIMLDIFASQAPTSKDDALLYAAINHHNDQELYANLKTCQQNCQLLIEEINLCKKIYKESPNLLPDNIVKLMQERKEEESKQKFVYYYYSTMILVNAITATSPIWALFVKNIIRKYMFKNSIQPLKVSILLKQVYGYEDIKKILRVIIKGIKKQKKSKKFEKMDGILFYGDPGCGKTYVAQALAHEADVPFFAIKVSDLLNNKGVVEDRIRLLFNKISGYVLNHKVPVILFIDEVDLLIPSRTQGKLSPEERLILQDFLSLLDGQIPLDGVLVIANTNYIKDIDVALLRRGRIGTHIEFKLPSKDDIIALITNFAKRAGIIIDDKFDMESFVALFEGKNVATIKASIALLKDYMIENNKKLILNNDLLASYTATFAFY